MRKPLAAYLAIRYFAAYFALLAISSFCGAAVGLRPSIAYLAALPVSLFATIAFCVVVIALAWNREFETLGSYGVPVWRIARPLTVGALTPQALFSVYAIVVAPHIPSAFLCTIAGLVAVPVCCAIVFTVVRRHGDRAALAACACGIAAQLAVVAVAELSLTRA